MDTRQVIFGVILILALTGTGLYSAYRQARFLREDRDKSPTGPFFRFQALRRLFCSLLMVMLAVQLGVALAYLETPAQSIVEKRDFADSHGLEFHLNDQDESFDSLYGLFWLGFLIMLFVLLAVLAYDLFRLRWLRLNTMREHNLVRRQLLEQTRRAREESRREDKENEDRKD